MTTTHCVDLLPELRSPRARSGASQQMRDGYLKRPPSPAHLVCVLPALLFSALAFEVNEAPSDERSQGFLLGADFPVNPPESLKELFYETGMNCIRLTGGGYRWAACMHNSLAEEFQTRGLKVYLQLGSHYPSAEYFARQDAWMVDQDGRTGVEDRTSWAIAYSGNHWPQYSYTSVGFRRQLESDFIEYLAGFAGNSNIAGAILHNEPGYFWMTDRVFDYGASNIAAFREWLPSQHASVAELNLRWGSKFTSFAEVQPPGKPPALSVGAWMDWRRFHAAAVARFMAWEAAFFKTLRPDVCTSTNLAGPLDHWFGYRCADNFACTRPMDVAGVDVYPTQWTNRVFIPYTIDLTHGVAQHRAVHVLECDVFGPRRWKHCSETERAGLLRGALWTMIGHGARAVLLWGFCRDDEFSLTDNGRYNQRVRVARDIAHQAKLISLGGFVRPGPRIAICVDSDSYLYAAALEEEPNELTSKEDVEAHGLYAALADKQLPVDVIQTSQLHAGHWCEYDAIILAGARLMDEQTAGRLSEFVARGGTLIADAPLARMDRWGNRFSTVPGAGLDRLFGVRSTGSLHDQPPFEIVTTGPSIKAVLTRESLELAGARAIGTLADGSPGLTLARHGEGRAIFINGCAGLAYMDNHGAGLAEWLGTEMASLAGDPRVALTCSNAKPLHSAVLHDPRGNLLVIASTLGDQAKLPPRVENAALQLSGVACDRLAGAFILAPTVVSRGIAKSGFFKLDSTVLADGKTVLLRLGDVTSATPVWLAYDAGPVLSIELPATAQPGQTLTAKVTCYNASTMPLDGMLTLLLRSGFAGGVPSTHLRLPPCGEAVTRLPCRVACDARGRLIVNAAFTPQGSGSPICGVPVDVDVGR